MRVRVLGVAWLAWGCNGAPISTAPVPGAPTGFNTGASTLRSCRELSTPRATPRSKEPTRSANVLIDLDEGAGELDPASDCPGSAYACWSVYRDPESDEQRLGQATTRLRAACRQDPSCGCWLWGEALLTRSKSQQPAAGVGVLLDACRAGAQPACESLEQRRRACSQTTGPVLDAECREFERRGWLLSPSITLTELAGCWQLSGSRFDTACIDERRLLLRKPDGAWIERRVLGWRLAARDRLDGMAVPRESGAFVHGTSVWPRASVQAFDGTQGRSYSIDLDAGSDGPWLPLTRPPENQRRRLEADLPTAWVRPRAR